MRGIVGRDVPVEGLGGAHRVAEDEHQRVGHRARRREAGQAGAGRGGGAHAAAHDGRVVERVGDVRVDVPRAEADDGLRRRRLDALARRVGPAGRLGQHAQDGRLVQPEGAVARPDAHDDLLGREGVAVGERLDDGVLAALAQDVGEQHLGLVDAAEDALLPREDLHDHDRVEALPCEDLLGAPEVDVRGVPAEDVVGGSAALPAHALHQGARV